MNFIRSALLAAMFAAPAAAFAADDEAGIPVKVFVIDEEEKPIATAVVRNPKEADRHRVNAFDWSWEAQELFLPDGTEIKFTKGMILELEISAPGYVNQHIQYTIRKRKNVFTVPLQKMQLDIEVDEGDDPVIQFGRDKPIDGQGSDPAN
jgi:hypothetical protein